MTMMLTVTAVEGDLLKLVWNDGVVQFPPYRISRGLLTQASDEVRKILSRISYEYVTNPDPDYKRFLSSLQTAGDTLFQNLFLIQSGNEAAAEDAKEMLEQATARPRLHVFSDASLHVPWGFCYMGTPTTEDTAIPVGLAAFRDFWLFRFHLINRLSRALRLSRPIRSRQTFKYLFALDREQITAAERLLTAEQRQRFNTLIRQEAGNATDWHRCKELWERIRDDDSIIFIYGHSDGKSIYLGQDDTPAYALHASRFPVLFKKRKDTESATICFLNGCYTGAGDWTRSFVSVTSGVGYHGFIGTEAEISNVAATAYGIEFMYRMHLGGLTVQETYQDLLLDPGLLPFNLMYSCYAHPAFTIEPALPSE